MQITMLVKNLTNDKPMSYTLLYNFRGEWCKETVSKLLDVKPILNLIRSKLNE